MSSYSPAPFVFAVIRKMTFGPALLSAAVFLASPVWSQIPRPTDAPKALTPEQSAAAFRLPAGFRMEIVASEPLIASPSAVCWDERGRMFVSELHGYNLAGQLDIEELNKTVALNVARMKEIVNPGDVTGRDLNSKQEEFSITCNIVVASQYLSEIR